MKKSLSVLLSAAVAFGSFASLTSAAEMTAQEKFEALKAKGIFTGVNAAGDAGLDQTMNRAQFARVAALILGLEGIGATDTLKVTEKPFSDVDLGKWYTEEVAAVKAAKVLVGNTDGTFNPEGNISVQELAVVTANLLGLKPVADATVEGAANWAAGYIKAIQNANVAFPTNYTEAATREQLVSLAYQADAAINNPATIGAVEAKATSVNKITVTFNGAVDKTKAKLDVKRDGTSSVTVDNQAWADDGKSVVLTLNSKIIAATYAVTLSGIDNLDSSKATASFVGTAEKITKIEFVTASDTLPKATGVKVEFKATNQYGEVSPLAASNFTISTGGVGTPANVAGEQAFTLNLSASATGDKVPVTIIDSNNGVQANKIFTVGDLPIVNKIEVGDLKDGDNTTITSVEPGKTVFVEYKAYDQYGVAVTDDALLNGARGVTVVVPDSALVKGTAAGITTNPAFVGNAIGSAADDLAFSAVSSATAKDVTVTFFANGTGASVQKVISIKTPSVPVSVDIGDFSSTLAVGDAGVYVPLVMKDAAGKALSQQAIADNAAKFTVYATGGVVTLASPAIKATGADKGKIQIASVDRKGSGSIVIQALDNPNVKATLNISTVDARVADRISVSTKAADKLLVAGYGATTSTLKLKTFDQYAGDSKLSTTTNAYVKISVEKVSGADADAATLAVPGATLSVTGTTYADISLSNLFDAGLTWTGVNGKSGTIKATAILYDAKGDGPGGTATDVELGRVTSQVVVYNGSSATLSYNVKVDGATDSTLYAAPKFTAGWNTPSAAGKIAKSVVVSATEGSATVALPTGTITSVTSSNPSVVGVAGDKVVGLAGGTSDLSVLFTTPTGISTASVKATVKEDLPTIQSLTVANGSKEVTLGDFDLNAGALTGTIKAVDQYGTEFNLVDFATGGQYAGMLNLKFFISNVKHGATSYDSVIIDANNGDITFTDAAGTGNGTSDITGFTINVIAPSGKVASTEVVF